jgi:hypothetical protein
MSEGYVLQDPATPPTLGSRDAHLEERQVRVARAGGRIGLPRDSAAFTHGWRDNGGRPDNPARPKHKLLGSFVTHPDRD